jgi:hypothetical protein
MSYTAYKAAKDEYALTIAREICADRGFDVATPYAPEWVGNQATIEAHTEGGDVFRIRLELGANDVFTILSKETEPA